MDLDSSLIKNQKDRINFNFAKSEIVKPNTEIKPDHSEIESAEWFEKSNLPTIPPRLSLSRSLIEKALNFLP